MAQYLDLAQMQFQLKIKIELREFILQNNISSIIDIPCGDWQWMSTFDLNNIDYKGHDIVEELIISNTKKYKSDNISFGVKNLINDSLPKTLLSLEIC